MQLEGRPKFDGPSVRRLLSEVYGLEGEVEALPGERDLNVRVRVDGGRDGVLKISNGQEDESLLEGEQRLFEHLAMAPASLRSLCPGLRKTLAGESRTTYRGENGQEHWVRLVDFLPGRPLATVEGPKEALLHDLGRALGRLQVATSDFHHRAYERSIPWDLSQGRRVVEERRELLQGAVATSVGAWLELYDRFVAPRFGDLPRAWIHNDANDHNVLVDSERGRIVGLIDFGDALVGPRIAELAVGAAYGILDAPEPLDALEAITSGFHAERPLFRDEIETLYGLVGMRLCMSAAIAAEQVRARPQDPYLSVSQGAIERTLPRLLERPYPQGTSAVLAACDPGTGFVPRDVESTREVASRRERTIGPSVRLTYEEPLHVERAWSRWLFSPTGERFLDAYNNVPHVGHGHPRVAAAVARQMRRLCTNTRYHYRSLGLYAERLLATFPGSLDRCFLLSSASEANELALRLARTATGHRDIVVMEGAYHGHTTTLIDISPYKHGGPGGEGAPSWVGVVRQPDLYRGPHREGNPEAVENYLGDVDRALGRMEGEGRRPAAFLAETCPSVGGQHILPRGYLAGVYDRIRAAGGLCIADEVQTGLGRMGDAFYAFVEHGVVPDIVVLGKPIGNGHPLAAVITTRAIAEAFDTGMEFFATFGGNTVACEAGLAVLDVLEEEDLQVRAARVGDRLVSGFRELAERHPAIGDVRGRGLFLGVELVLDRDRRDPATDLASRVKNGMRSRGVLIGTDGLDDNVLKVRPPMPFDRGDAGTLLDTLDEVLTQASSGSLE